MTQATIVGRIVSDAELRTAELDGGVKVPVTDVTIAASEGYGERKTTSFWRVSLWRDTAQKLQPSLKKGRIVSVHGTPTARAYNRKVDGAPAAQLELKNAVLEFLDKKPEEIEAEAAEAEAPATETDETPFA